jgi:DNA-binding beta-propeller fold protein YncE
MTARAAATAPLGLALAALACSQAGTLVPLGGESDHSSSIAVSADARTVYVVNADADSVSFVDARAGSLAREVRLGGVAPPQLDSEGRYEPAVEPRALALGPGQATLYVTGRRSGRVYALDAASGALVASAYACSEPVGVVVSREGDTVYVACSQDATVLALDAQSLAVTARVATPPKPWTLAWSADRSRLLVTHLLGPGVSVLAPSPLALTTTWALAEARVHGEPAGTDSDPTVPHGVVRGVYDALARPGSRETWVAHLMLGIDTAQPALVFNTTAFPALSLLDAGGTQLARLTVSTAPADGGAFGDVVSGPRAMAFSSDGGLLFVTDTASEDVLVVDAEQRVETALVRPLPGHQPEGIAVGSDGRVYVDERNTSDVAVLTVTPGAVAPQVTVTGAIRRVAQDPMPASLRAGQRLFNSANSDEAPITTDHWIACTTCHIEGRSDAVTWRFLEGPRDTPSNAGGVSHTGFLLRTAERTRVQDYWRTINDEQGGHFDPNVPLLAADLDALADYVDHAIPYPSPPSGLDPAEVARGKEMFAQLGCPSCHAGTYFTDSGAGNPSLDLAGPVMLHDVGTCVTRGPFDDAAATDIDGHARSACAFDTPSLRGVGDTPPYLHDGSAATLDDVFRLAPHMVGPAAAQLSADGRRPLIAYLRSL